VKVSNADRVVFPDDGITKGEVVGYYDMVSERMFPHVDRRALTVERYPKGLDDDGFMQKNAPTHFGEDLIDRKEVPKDGGGTTVYPVLSHAGAIPAYANLGAITFHVPPSTVDDEWHPDWVIWDLDPPEGGLGPVREAALVLREVLGAFGIPALLMTSGSKGYHLRTPVEAGPDAGELAEMARGIAALAAAAHPDLLTLAFRKSERRGRVFVDWLRNAPYSTSVVPWSLRARSGAPVAAPIHWDELDSIGPADVRFSDVADLEEDVWASGSEPVDISTKPRGVETALEDGGIELEPFDRFRS
jgi:bifunctional non-homologous end joining protein LigD